MTDTATPSAEEVVKPRKPRKNNIGDDPTTGGLIRRWQFGFYAFAIGACAIVVGTTLWSLLRGNVPRAGLAVSFFLVAITWNLLRTSLDSHEIEGNPVTNDEPKLQAFVASIAAELDVEPPSEIVLTVQPQLDLRQITRHFGRTIERSALVIGLPFLATMTVRELAGLLAHAIGHSVEGEVHEGPLAIRSLWEGERLVAAERSGFVDGVYGSYARKMFRSFGGVAVAQEKLADHLAAKAYGTDTVISGLAKVDDTVIAFDQMLRDYVVPAMQNDMHPTDLFHGFRELFESSVRADERQDALTRRKDEERNEFVLHQKPDERIALLNRWPHQAGTAQLDNGDASALTLLDPDAKTADVAVALWATKLLDKRTEPRDWQHITENVLTTSSSVTASIPFDEDQTADEQFVQMLAWAEDGDWTEADEALEPSLKKRQTVDERRTEWVHAVVAEAAAASPSIGWKHNWDGPPLLTHEDGTVFDAESVATKVLAGDVASARSALQASA